MSFSFQPMIRQLLIPFYTFFLFTSACQSQPPTEIITEIPVYLVDNRPFVKVQSGETEGYFIVDTGGRMGFDVQFARRAGLTLTDSFSISGAGDGHQTAWHTSDQMIKINGIRLTSSRPVVTDLSVIRDSLHLPYLDGVIGLELFLAYRVTIDYVNRKMFIQSNGGSAPAGATVELPFKRYRNQMPMINSTLDGEFGEFIIDTGDRSDLTIFPDFADKAGVGNRYALSERQVTGYGIGGKVMARTFILPEFKLGTLTRRKIPARIPYHEQGSWSHSDITGSIGSGFLRNYKVTFDYSVGKLWISETQEPEISEFIYYSSDPEKIARWYAEHFPFEVAAESDGAFRLTYEHAVIVFRRSNDIVTTKAFKNSHAGKVRNGTFKYGMDVPGLDSVYARLKLAQGVDLMGSVITFNGTKMILVRDPEGNTFQLFEPQGTVTWRNSFLALITEETDEYDQWANILEEKGFSMMSDYSRPEHNIRQQNFVRGMIKVELLLLEERATGDLTQKNSGVAFKEILQKL